MIGHGADHRLMDAMGLDVTRPDSGCCGMAGSFGYEAGDKYDVSIACGERVIAPEVRAVSEGTVVLADGFSCRSQISDLTGRQPLHLAQVLALAQRHGPQGPTTARPEDAETPLRASPAQRAGQRALVAGGAVGVAAVAVLGGRRARRR